jgi:general secretion pathway protein D
MKVDEARNLLVLAGTSQELATMLDVVKTFDVDWLAGMSYGFFNLNYVDAKTVETELSAILADPKSPLAGVIRLVPLPRLNTILVITPQPKYLQSVETWIKRLDIGGTSAGRRIYVYDVQNGRAEDLARSLTRILSLPSGADDSSSAGRGLSNTGTSGQFGLGSGSGLGSASSFGSGFSPGSNTGTVAPSASGGLPLSSSTAASNGFQSGSAKSGDLRIVANNDSNALMILANPAEFSVIEAALQRLDAPSRQVLIEASLAEVTLTDELRYGVQWSYSGKNGPVTLSDAGKITQSFPGLSFLYTGSTSISAVLNALESVTKVRVISSPKLVTLNNHQAQLQVGDQVPVTTQSAVSTSTSDAPIVNSVAMRDTGVILEVTPRVNKNGLVQLDISQELSNSIPTTTSNIDSPTIQERKFSSTVVVKNGDTVALGGLITEDVTKSRSGVPYLSKVPLLGGLFRDTHDTKTRTELILLITPRVMRDDAEFQDVMDDLRNEFQALKKVFKELLLSGLAATVAYIARVEAVLTRRAFDLARAQAAADAAIVNTISKLSDEQVSRHTPLGVSQSWEFDGLPITITVSNEAGRIDVNTASDELLLAFLQIQGLTKDAASILVAELRNRQETSPEALGHAVSTRDLPISIDALHPTLLETTEELRQIPGWREQNLNCWLDSLTVFSGRSDVAATDGTPGALSALRWMNAHRPDGSDEPVSASVQRPDSTRSVLGEVVRIRASATILDVTASSEWIGRLTGDVGRPMLTMRWDQGRQRASTESCSAKL